MGMRDVAGAGLDLGASWTPLWQPPGLSWVPVALLWACKCPQGPTSGQELSALIWSLHCASKRAFRNYGISLFACRAVIKSIAANGHSHGGVSRAGEWDTANSIIPWPSNMESVKWICMTAKDWYLKRVQVQKASCQASDIRNQLHLMSTHMFTVNMHCKYSIVSWQMYSLVGNEKEQKIRSPKLMICITEYLWREQRNTRKELIV